MGIKQQILSRTNQGLDVFKFYLKVDWVVGRNFRNPFYDDKRPSCNVYKDKHSGVYKMKDFGNESYSGDCFALVGNIFSLDCRNKTHFMEIMKIIDRDLRLGLFDKTDLTPRKPQEPKLLASNEKEEETHRSTLSLVEQPFSLEEIKFWKQYGISLSTLQTFRVVSVKTCSGINRQNKPYELKSHPNEPMYAYKRHDHVKIYRPFSTLRFLQSSNSDSVYCFGLEQLPHKGDMLFITGGEKDVMTLHAHGFNAICFNSETSLVPEELVESLSRRFRHIVLLFDMDKTGVEASKREQERLSAFSVLRLELPLSGEKSEKDVSDYFRSGAKRDDLKFLVLQLLETVYRETLLMMKSCEIDYQNPPTMPENIISVNGVPLGSTGNLLCITGGEGTGKSNFVSALIAGSIRETKSVNIDTLGLDVSCNESNKAVILYDTEQSEAQLFKNVSNTLRRASMDEMPANFKAFYLATMSRKERLQSIRDSMDLYYHRFGGIQLIVIDGIADLIRSANDETESIALVDELYRLAAIYQTCIIGVLHFVPNGIKLRGHIGSEMQRKSAGILSIEKDDDPAVSVVKALKVRDGSPLDVPILQFSWDKTYGMHRFRGEKPKEDKEKRKENELTSVAKQIFSGTRFLTYNELSKEIEDFMAVSERTAKNYIRYMREKGIVTKDPSNSTYYIIGINL
ncbi:MAG: toprim domain-containing protein [Bacteroidota bacterium]|nr:toprim domain-containing protein [Bacteroidota bacterium]